MDECERNLRRSNETVKNLTEEFNKLNETNFELEKENKRLVQINNALKKRIIELDDLLATCKRTNKIYDEKIAKYIESNNKLKAELRVLRETASSLRNKTNIKNATLIGDNFREKIHSKIILLDKKIIEQLSNDIENKKFNITKNKLKYIILNGTRRFIEPSIDYLKEHINFLQEEILTKIKTKDKKLMIEWMKTVIMEEFAGKKIVIKEANKNANMYIATDIETGYMFGGFASNELNKSFVFILDDFEECPIKGYKQILNQPIINQYKESEISFKGEYLILNKGDMENCHSEYFKELCKNEYVKVSSIDFYNVIFES